MVPDSDSVAPRRQTQFLSMSEPYSSSVTLSRTIFLMIDAKPAGLRNRTPSHPWRHCAIYLTTV